MIPSTTSQPMLSFTDVAIDRLNNVLEASETVRVAVMGGGCAGMTYTLTIDSHSASILEKTTIDFVSMGLNEGFVFNNPEANTTCGCGSSFS